MHVGVGLGSITRLRRSTATRAGPGSRPFVIGLLLLKYIYGLSDDGVCERAGSMTYFQHFTGETFFQHEFPHERSDLSHWSKRLGASSALLPRLSEIALPDLLKSLSVIYRNPVRDFPKHAGEPRCSG